MKKYLVIQKTSASKFQAALNDLHGDGYELTDFQVVSDAGEPVGFFGVMKLRQADTHSASRRNRQVSL